jgi:hypothetical protein
VENQLEPPQKCGTVSFDLASDEIADYWRAHNDVLHHRYRKSAMKAIAQPTSYNTTLEKDPQGTVQSCLEEDVKLVALYRYLLERRAKRLRSCDPLATRHSKSEEDQRA